MSIMYPVTLDCPHCGVPFECQRSASVNVDRHPELRAAILDGTFQRETCPHCKATCIIDPHLNYLDVGRGQWFAVFPTDWMDQWDQHEASTTDLYARAFGAEASAAARDIGIDLKPRLVFGWRALGEKLVAADAGLNDVDLELTKMALIRDLGEQYTVGEQLRLISVDPDLNTITFLVIAYDSSEDDPKELTVPRDIYDNIAANEDGWQALRDDISAGLFVDMARFLRGPDDAAQA